MTSSSSEVTFNFLAATNSYAVINGNLITLSGTYSVKVQNTSYSAATASATYSVALVLDTQGLVKAVTTKTPNTNPTVSTSDIVLGTGQFAVAGGVMSGFSYTDITIDGSGYVHLTQGTQSTDGYTIATSSTTEGAIIVTFPNTNSTPNTSDYDTYRKFKLFNSILSYINTSSSFRGLMLLEPETNTVKKTLDGVVS